MDKRRSIKGWLFLLPAILFLAAFMLYPLFDVFIYSFEEGYNFATQSYFGTGIYNYSYVLRDPYFIQALKNTFIIVMITVPLSTLIALFISLGLSSIKWLRELFQTVYFLPYVTNTLAVGLVFIFKGSALPGLAIIGAALICAGLAIFAFFGCKAATKGAVALTKEIAAGIKRPFIKKEEKK